MGYVNGIYERECWRTRGEALRILPDGVKFHYPCLTPHSIVPGGFDAMSYVTRLMPFTSLMMRVETWRGNPVEGEEILRHAVEE